MKRPRIAVLGAGHVGSATAHGLAQHDLGDIVLVDVVGGDGDRLDGRTAGATPRKGGRHAGRLPGLDSTVGCDVIVIAGGFGARSPMEGVETEEATAGRVAECVERVVRKSRDGKIIVATRPFGAVSEVVHEASGFPRERIIGLAGVVESERMRALIAAELGVGTESVATLVVGGCAGPALPLARFTAVAGVPVAALLPPERIAAITSRVAGAWPEIHGQPVPGAVMRSVSDGIARIVRAIGDDSGAVLPCAAHLDGEFGLAGVWAGVPCRIGETGIRSVFEVPLTDGERAALARDAVPVRARDERRAGGAGGERR